ncbi:MAG: hypothetical protein IBX50_15890 [Marinospirillum sp.]|nr:hypothetical protein [Marinospirillum sp.]
METPEKKNGQTSALAGPRFIPMDQWLRRVADRQASAEKEKKDTPSSPAVSVLALLESRKKKDKDAVDHSLDTKAIVDQLRILQRQPEAQANVALNAAIEILESLANEDVVRCLLDARALAMKNVMAARIPECGDFGAIAQDLDYACRQLKIADQPSEVSK